MDGFQELWPEFEARGVSILAGSVDDEGKARKLADGKSFPFAWGMTRADADRIGAWWEDRRGIVQPSEFILDGENRVQASSYSDGPLGRMDAADALRLIDLYEARRKAGG